MKRSAAVAALAAAAGAALLVSGCLVAPARARAQFKAGVLLHMPHMLSEACSGSGLTACALCVALMCLVVCLQQVTCLYYDPQTQQVSRGASHVDLILPEQHMCTCRRFTCMCVQYAALKACCWIYCQTR